MVSPLITRGGGVNTWGDLVSPVRDITSFTVPSTCTLNESFPFYKASFDHFIFYLGLSMSSSSLV